MDEVFRYSTRLIDVSEKKHPAIVIAIAMAPMVGHAERTRIWSSGIRLISTPFLDPD